MTRQGDHQDFKKGEGLFCIMVSLADAAKFEYTLGGGKKVCVLLNKGDIVVFDSELEHNGPPYDVPGADDNLFLRYHTYCEFKNATESDKSIIHLKTVSD